MIQVVLHSSPPLCSASAAAWHSSRDKRLLSEPEQNHQQVKQGEEHLSKCGAKSSEDVQVASDKVEYLNKIKQKLESTLDKPEFSVKRQKEPGLLMRKKGKVS